MKCYGLDPVPIYEPDCVTLTHIGEHLHMQEGTDLKPTEDNGSLSIDSVGFGQGMNPH